MSRLAALLMVLLTALPMLVVPAAAPAFADARGDCFAKSGEEAIADFRRALAIEPRLSGSRQGLKRLGASP